MNHIAIVACFCLTSSWNAEKADGLWQAPSRNSSKALVRSSSTSLKDHEALEEASIGADGALHRPRQAQKMEPKRRSEELERELARGPHLAKLIQNLSAGDDHETSEVFVRHTPQRQATSEESSSEVRKSLPSRVQELAAESSSKVVSLVETVRVGLWQASLDGSVALGEGSSSIALSGQQHATAKAGASGGFFLGACVLGAIAVVGSFVWRYQQRRREQAAVQIQAVYRGGQERSNILEKNEEEEEDGN